MSKSIFVDPSTGEIVDEETPDCVELEIEDDSHQPDHEWLGDWLTKQHAHMDAEEVALKVQYQRRLRMVSARRAHYAWVYAPRLEAVVREELRGAKRKSVQFAYGPAGFRKSSRADVHDEDAAMSWAEENAPDAIKVVPETRSLLKSKLPKGAVVPGVTVTSEEKFFVRAAKS